MSAVLQLATTTDRRKFLGGSDIAGIVGVSKWATPADVYFRKIGRAEEAPTKIDPVRERIYKRGKRMEPVVIEMLADELGIEVTKTSPPDRPNRYIDPEHGFLAAEIDFEWRVRAEDVAQFPWARNLEVGSIQNGEVKTVAPFPALMQEWGEMDTDEVPIDYAFQSMHGLGVTRRQACMYGVLFGSDNLVTYAVLRDEETIAHIRRRAVQFWREHVEKDVPPAPQTIEDLQRMYLRATLGRRIAEPELVERVVEMHAVMDQVKALTERKAELEFQVKEALGPAEALVDERGRTLVTWKNSTSSGLDEHGLKEKYPLIHAEFYRTVDTRRFSLTGRRGR